MPFKPGPEEVAEALGRFETELEELRNLAEGLRLTSAIVREISQDGNLKVLKAHDGTGELQLVTTSRVEVGDVLVVALPGTVLPGGFKVEARKIRGHLSEGMPLSEEELGLAEKSEEIIRLREDELKPGEDPLPLLQLDTWLFDVYTYPHRGDHMGVLGLARELSAVLGGEFVVPKYEFPEDPEVGAWPVEIEDPDACSRYTARLVKGLKSLRSPRWLRYRLALLGQRSINLAVDATNYAAFHLGEPTHVFDLRTLEGGIKVRWAKEGERILTLDGVERELEPDVLLIADERKPLAVAGVIGGEETGVVDAEEVLIEAACFKPEVIARTSRRFNILTESSRRFERGVDPELAPLASNLIAYLLWKYGGGTPGPLNDQYPGRREPRRVKMSLKWLKGFAGYEFPAERVPEILKKLGYGVKLKGEEIEAEVPSWRYDVSWPADLAEDALKHLGYELVPQDKPSPSPTQGGKAEGVLDRAVRVLAGLGFLEAKNLGLHGLRELEAWGFTEALVRISNPLGEEFAYLRPSLLPGLARAAALNLRRGRGWVMLAEAGPVFQWRGDKELPEERWLLGLAVAGKLPRTPYTPERDLGPWELKGAVEALFKELGRDLELEPAEAAWALKGTAWKALSGAEELGILGMLRPTLAEELYEVKAEVWLGELALPEPAERCYSPIGRYPGVRRDVSVLVDAQVPYAQLARDAAQALPPEAQLRLIDVYAGKGVPEGKVSYTLSVFYRHSERTLTDEEVNAWHERLVKALREKGYLIRGLDA